MCAHFRLAITLGHGQVEIPHALWSKMPSPVPQPLIDGRVLFSLFTKAHLMLCANCSLPCWENSMGGDEMIENGRKEAPCQHPKSAIIPISFHRTPPYLILLIGFRKVGTIWSNILNNDVYKNNHTTMPISYSSLLIQYRLTRSKFLFQRESREGLQKHFASGLHA